MRFRAFALLPFLLAPLAWGAGDAAQGAKLVAEHKCETCHHNKTMGDAKAIYLRKDRKVTTPAKLKAQGTGLYVCGQNLAAIGLDPKALTPDVEVASDALLTLIALQQKGYALLSY